MQRKRHRRTDEDAQLHTDLLVIFVDSPEISDSQFGVNVFLAVKCNEWSLYKGDTYTHLPLKVCINLKKTVQQ